MLLAGVRISEDLAAELASHLRGDGYAVAADRIETATEAGKGDVALDIADREAILRTLGDWCPDGLAELRGVLLREHAWRLRNGLNWMSLPPPDDWAA